MDQDILRPVEIGVDSQNGRPAADIAQARGCGLLHHFTQISGQPEHAGAVDDGHLHVQGDASDAGPGKAAGQADGILPALFLRFILAHAQIALQLLEGDRYGILPLFHQLHGSLAAERAQFPFQSPDAGLLGPAADDGPEDRIGNTQLFCLQPVLLPLFGQQMVLGDMQLFFIGVAVELDDLHPVQKRPGDGGGRIGSRDENHVAQIEGNFQIVIAEGVILLAVQRFQKG